MEPSPEIEALTRRWWTASASGDVETIVGLLSEGDEVCWVGTDPDEEWRDRPTIEAVIRTQNMEVGGAFPVTLLDVFAWEEGTVGWSYSTGRLEVDPKPFVVRKTAVFHLERGHWRLVHTLVSSALRNEDVFGFHLTTSVDLIAKAVEVERPDVRPATVPDGTVTLLFTDIEGSTERNAVLGDREWMQILREHHRIIRDQVAASSGFEVKSMGDGFMIAFASAGRALRCAIDIQHAVENSELGIRVRAGLHSGEAVRDGDDFYGGVVNMAARVAGQAAGGEILTSTIVQGLVAASGEFSFAEPRAATLKGFAGAQELHALLF